jgi:hypothetical protein
MEQSSEKLANIQPKVSGMGNNSLVTNNTTAREDRNSLEENKNEAFND